VFDRIFDAAEFVIGGYVSGDADNEQVAQTLIKDQFRWDSGIGTAHDYGEWMLPVLKFSSTRQGLIGVLLLVARVALIALHKPGKRLISRYRIVRVLTPTGYDGGQEQQRTSKGTFSGHHNGI
jgi:hypothetical protein